MIKPFCHDCGVKEGQLHWDGCDNEYCTKCGKQVLMHGRCKGAKRNRFFSDAGFFCQRCGLVGCDMKMVSDKTWKEICSGNYKEDCMLFPECMNFIIEKKKIKEVKYGNLL